MTRFSLREFLNTILGLLFVSVFSLMSSGNAYAAEEKPAIYLQVSPASQQLGELKPGEKYTGTFKVQNVGAKEFTYSIYASPYYVSGENYNPVYEETGSYSMIKDWFTFSKTEGTISAGTDDEITYTVTVPENAPGGGQYASIMVETSDSASETATIKATSRVGMIVYSHVNGETKECGNILNLNIPTFLTQPPISASSLVENCGNVDLQASYTLKVTPLFSNEEVYTTEDDPLKLSTLPETKRFNTVSWDSSPLIGIYNVEEIIEYAGKTQSIHKTVMICPIWVIVLVIIFIGAVVFWLVSRNRERKVKKTTKDEE